jgi:hypothetical protein
MRPLTLSSEQILLDQLKFVINITPQQTICIQAGHAPMIYTADRSVYIDTGRWGEFSIHSFEMGCVLARYALDKKKTVKLLLVSDDIIEIPKDETGKRNTKTWMRLAAKTAYRTHTLPEAYRKIAYKHNVLQYIVGQKRSFGTSHFISEMSMILKSLQAKEKSNNECSLFYNILLDDPTFYNKDTDYMISFIPGQCKGNICEGVLDIRQDLSSTHIFFPHIEVMGGILDMGNGFEKIGDPMPIAEMYKKNLISVRTT